MKEIPLTHGKVVFVDDEDYEKVSPYKWCLWKSKKNPGLFYAIANIGNRRKGNHTTIRMHRLLLNPSSNEVIDHIDGDGLNNTRRNLRIATKAQNGSNQKRLDRSKYSSKYKGVWWSHQNSKWMSGLRCKGKNIYLGLFDDEKKAALAYNEAVKVYHGEFANLNSM